MEAFDIGTHVVIELDDDRKVAGYIVGVAEDGLILNATHKESAMKRFVSAAASADIRRQLNDKGLWTLRLSALLAGRVLDVGRGKAALVEVIAEMVEEDLLSAREDGIQLRELSNPVLTFVNFGFVKLMEDTDDVIVESEISVFNQTMDSNIKELFDEDEINKASEQSGAEEKETHDESIEIEAEE